VTTTSQQAADPLFTMPVSFTVVGQTFLEADFDNSGSVDGPDLASWSANFGIQANAQKFQGDADADADVDGADFLVWQRQLGGSPATIAAAAVPEPNALLLAALPFAAATIRLRFSRASRFTSHRTQSSRRS
jgi:hypothetical protein